LEVLSDGFSIAAGDTGAPSSAWNTAVARDCVESSEQVDWGVVDPYGGKDGIIDNDTGKGVPLVIFSLVNL